MKKIIYIAGLGHSGSTILDMALGCHPSIIGLGEVKNLLLAKKQDFNNKKFTQILCSCGQNMIGCDFWSEIRENLLANSSNSIEAKLRLLIEYFDKKYGNDKIMVDSSKDLTEYLSFYSRNYKLYVIFLIRDVRSWVYSRHSRHGKSIIGLAFSWFKGNFKIKQYLMRQNINFMTVGYEELSLYPDILLRKICKYINIKYDQSMLVPANSKSHIIRGNVARGDDYKRKAFFYDARWFTSSKLAIFGPVLLPIIKWNYDNVYSNFVTGRTKAFSVSQNDFLIFGDKKKEDLLEDLREN